jgi:hypothetical protein
VYEAQLERVYLIHNLVPFGVPLISVEEVKEGLILVKESVIECREDASESEIQSMIETIEEDALDIGTYAMYVNSAYNIHFDSSTFKNCYYASTGKVHECFMFVLYI